MYVANHNKTVHTSVPVHVVLSSSSDCYINTATQLLSFGHYYRRLAGMGVLVYLICIAVASFAVLAQPAVAQGANITLPFTYPV